MLNTDDDGVTIQESAELLPNMHHTSFKGM